MAKTIVIAADHGGFALKEKVKKILKKSRYKLEDKGTFSPESCDYPEYGFNAGRMVSQGKAYRAIIICKSGIGMAVVANKLPGVRAGVCTSVEDAVSSRQHNDTNVLVLAANKTSKEKAEEIIKVWLRTRTLGGRHSRRVKQIKALEKKVFK
ncbi:MAG: ribose 5-phosphate isomerase B [Candidatus Omnitrophota bacterium]